MIRLYQWTLSPIVGRQCRFIPTCSHYGVAVLRTYGPLLGLRLTIVRIARCNPLVRSGIDPPPQPRVPGPSTAPTDPPARP